MFSDFTLLLLKYKASHIKASKNICPTILKKENQQNQIILHIKIICVSNETLFQLVPTIACSSKSSIGGSDYYGPVWSVGAKWRR